MKFASLSTDEQGTVSIYVTTEGAPEQRSRLWTRFSAADWVLLMRARWGMLLCPQYYPEAIFDALRAA